MASADFDPTGFIMLIVGIALAGVVTRWLISRRNVASLAAAESTPDAVGTPAQQSGPAAVSFVIAPAAPLTENLAQLRALVGETAPEPKITRFTRPVLTVDGSGITLSDAKLGAFLTIPAGDVRGVEARVAEIKPAGTLLARTWPAVWITVRRAETTIVVPFTPIQGAYDKVAPRHAEALAAAVAHRLGLSPL